MMIRRRVHSGLIGLLAIAVLLGFSGSGRGEGQPIMRDLDALALKLADLGLVSYPGSETLAALRRQALDGLRARHQQLDPFKFIIYSERAGAALVPVE
jgi:hypothetical protein